MSSLQYSQNVPADQRPPYSWGGVHIAPKKAFKKIVANRGIISPVPPLIQIIKSSIASEIHAISPIPVEEEGEAEPPGTPQGSGLQGIFLYVDKGLKGKRAKRY